VVSVTDLYGHILGFLGHISNIYNIKNVSNRNLKATMRSVVPHRCLCNGAHFLKKQSDLSLMQSRSYIYNYLLRGLSPRYWAGKTQN
jgi:hypothetical protein